MMQISSRPTLPAEFVMTGKTRFTVLMLLLGMGVFLSILLAACLGTVPIAPADALRIIFYKVFQWNIDEISHQFSLPYIDIIWELRLPRVLLAAIAGAGLAACGTVMQASVQNPLAEPYILGISAGASLGATFSLLLPSFNFFALGTPFWAFIGAVGASFFVLALSGIGGHISTIKIILAGITANALFSALANFIIYIANNAEGLQAVAFWTMGSLAAASWEILCFPAIGFIVCSMFFLFQSRVLNSLLLGEEAAMTLGVDLAKVRRNYMIITALMTGLIVSVCGIFGFVGLMIPHIMRSFVGADHRRLLPSAILAGAIFLIWADVFARIILKTGELPIGIITALIGAPFFMYILLKRTFTFGAH